MGFWSNLFGGKKKKPVRRAPLNSAAVARLATRRGCSVYDLDLCDDSIIEELLLLGLMLSDDGQGFVDDPNWVEPVVEPEFVAEDIGTLDVTSEIEEVIQETEVPVEVEPTIREATPPILEPVPAVYEAPPVSEPVPAPEPAPEPSWTSEPSESSWSSSSDSGSSWDSGGGSDFGGGGCDD